MLIVEDDYLVAMQAESSLCDAGFAVVGVAATADGAVSLARAERPTLVVMDIRLAEGGDGVDAALRIFRSEGIRCIFATAHTDPWLRNRAQPAEPLGWLPKPYSMESLVAMTREAAVRVREGK